MSENIVLFLRGILIGFSIAAPVGPIGVLCIRRTISNGWMAGLFSGLGAATADALYGCIAAFGLVAVSSLLIEQQFWLQAVGGIFLAFLGVRIFLSTPHETQDSNPELSQWGIITAYGSTFLLTISNPLTILSFAGVFAGLGLGNIKAGVWSGSLIVIGVFTGSASWWLLLSSLIARLERLQKNDLLVWVNRISGVIVFGFGLMALAGLFTQDRVIRSVLEVDRVGFAPQTDATGFSRATSGRILVFPDDDGAHPDFQTEWWYFTGNLSDGTGQHFGYQLTFFRRALLPPASRPTRDSQWGTDQVYLAHLALTNVQAQEHISFERLARGGGGVAGVQADPFEVWLDDWDVVRVGPETYQLHAGAILDDGTLMRLAFEMQDLKGPILQGDHGYSQKGPDPGDASYYYSLTRLQTSGSIELGDRAFSVQGFSWMDHEFSTSALGPDQVGWDWFSIQLDDNSEIMVFQLRRKDGSIDPYSSGIWVSSDGNTEQLTMSDFSIQVLDTWTSPSSGGTYPSRWKLTVPDLGLELELTPFILDQEMDLSYRYWEGAVSINGIHAGIPVEGSGFVEMTGYAGLFEGEF